MGTKDTKQNVRVSFVSIASMVVNHTAWVAFLTSPETKPASCPSRLVRTRSSETTVDTSNRPEDDLTDVLTRFEQPMRLGGAGKRKRLEDDGLHGPRFDERP